MERLGRMKRMDIRMSKMRRKRTIGRISRMRKMRLKKRRRREEEGKDKDDNNDYVNVDHDSDDDHDNDDDDDDDDDVNASHVKFAQIHTTIASKCRNFHRCHKS